MTKKTGFNATVSQMTRMGLRYLGGHKLRTFLTTLAIVFGVSLIFAVNLVLPSVTEALEDSLSRASGADIRFANTTDTSFAPDEVLETVAAVDGVRAVSGILDRTMYAPDGDESTVLDDISQIELIGVDPVSAQDVRQFTMRDGRFLETDETGVAVLSAGITEVAPEVQVGAQFPIYTAEGLKTFTVIGLIDEQGSLTTPQIYVTLADAQRAFNQPGLINIIEVNTDASADVAQVTDAIQAALGSGYKVDEATSVTESIGAFQLTFSFLDLLGFLALFLGAFLIFNTFRTVVRERHHDLALLRAIGATRRQITLLVLIESLIQGIIGTVIGLILGYLMASALLNVVFAEMYDRFFSGLEVSLRVNAYAVLLATVLGIVTALLAGYFPARSASKTSPIEALRPATAATVHNAARWSLVVGIVLMLIATGLLISGSGGAIGGALLFLFGILFASPGLIIPVARLFSPLLTLWFAREGDLARGNLSRQPGRAAITGSTLMIGLAVFILMAATVLAFDDLVKDLTDRAFASDIVLMPQSIGIYDNVVGTDDTLTTRLRELPEMDTVTGLRFASTKTDGQALQVLGIDPAAFPNVTRLSFNEGDPDSVFAAMADGRNAVLTPLAFFALKIEVGDTLVLETAEGPQSYTIVGVASDVLSFKVNSIYISQANLAADFHQTGDVLVYMTLTPGADREAALADVEAITQDYPQYTAHLSKEYANDMIAMTEVVYPVFYMLAFLILFPAALGLLNTLTINTLERTREIGVVRAVGGTRGQVRKIVTAEALLLGIFSAATGVVAGVAMSYGFIGAFDIIGWKVAYTFPVMGIIASVIIGVMLTLFAAILPARNAAQLDIIRALQYE